MGRPHVISVLTAHSAPKFPLVKAAFTSRSRYEYTTSPCKSCVSSLSSFSRFCFMTKQFRNSSPLIGSFSSCAWLSTSIWKPICTSFSRRWSSAVSSMHTDEITTPDISAFSDDGLSSMATSLEDYEALLLETEEEESPVDATSSLGCSSGQLQKDEGESPPGSAEIKVGNSVTKASVPGVATATSSLQLTATLLEMIKDVLPEDGKLMRLTDLSPSVDLELLEHLPSLSSSGSTSSNSHTAAIAHQGVSLLEFLRMHPRHFRVVQVEESLSGGGVVKRWHVQAQHQGADNLRCGTSSRSNSSSSNSGGNNSGSYNGRSAQRAEGDHPLDTLDVSSLFLEEEMKQVLKSASCAQRKAENPSVHNDSNNEKWRNKNTSLTFLHEGTRTGTRRLQSILPEGDHDVGSHSSVHQGDKGNDSSMRPHRTAWLEECRMVWQRVAELLKPGEVLSVFQLRTRVQEIDPEVLEWLRENPSPFLSSKDNCSHTPPPPVTSPTSITPTQAGFRRLLWQHRDIAKEFLDYDAISVEGWISMAGELKGKLGAELLSSVSKTRETGGTEVDALKGSGSNDNSHPGLHTSLLWTKKESQLPTLPSSVDPAQLKSMSLDEQYADDWVVELNLDDEEENLWSMDDLEDLEDGDLAESQEGKEEGTGCPQVSVGPSSSSLPLTKKQKKQLRERAEADREKNSIKKKAENISTPSLSTSLASPEVLLQEHTRLAEERGWYTPAEILDLLVECVPSFPVPVDQLVSSDALIKLFGFNLSMRRVVLVYRYYFVIDMDVVPSPTICLHPEKVVGVHPQAGVANPYYKKWECATYEKRGAPSPPISARTAPREMPVSYSPSGSEEKNECRAASTSSSVSNTMETRKDGESRNETARMTDAVSNTVTEKNPTSEGGVAGGVSGNRAPSEDEPCRREVTDETLSKAPNTTGRAEAIKTGMKRGGGSSTSGGAFASLRRIIKSKVVLRHPEKRGTTQKPNSESSASPVGIVPSEVAKAEGSPLSSTSPADLCESNVSTTAASPESTTSNKANSSLSGTEKREKSEEDSSVRQRRNSVPLSASGVALHGLMQHGNKKVSPMVGTRINGKTVGMGSMKSILHAPIPGEGVGKNSLREAATLHPRRDSMSGNLLHEALQLIYDNAEFLHENIKDTHSNGTSSDGSTRTGTSMSHAISPLGEVLSKLLLTVPYTHFIPLEEVAARCGTDVDTLEDLLDRSQPTQSRYAAFLVHTSAATSSSHGSAGGGVSRPARRRRLIRFRPLWVAPNSTGDLTATPASSTSSSNAFNLPASFLRKLLPTWRPLYRIVESMPPKDRDRLLSAALHSSSLVQYLTLFGRSPCWVEEQLSAAAHPPPLSSASGKDRKGTSSVPCPSPYSTSPSFSSSSGSTASSAIDPHIRVRRYTGDLEMDDIESVGLRALYYCCHPHKYRSLEAVLSHAQKAEYAARMRFGLPTTSLAGGGGGLILGEGIANMLSELTVMAVDESQSLPRRISRHPTLFEVSETNLHSFSTSQKAACSFLIKRRTVFTTANYSNASHKKK